ncbi:MAG TPA: hypothetical protein VLK27_12480 [Chthoniobacterales bacterium]|nr:hypothetical protein [Chthoniobacterales bacterium]
MNDFSELEDQLRKLRPVQPSPELATRIERALAEPETSSSTAGLLSRERHFHFNWLSIGLGLAAATALVLLAFVQLHQPAKQTPTVASTKILPPVTPSTAQLVPAGLTQVVYHTRDEGVHFPGNSDQPMRRVRSHTRETLQWRNPKTGATLRITYPTEQISLHPVSGQ